MKKTNQKALEEIIRVDHAGERGAMKIYEGQLLALKTIKQDNDLKDKIEEMKEQEKEHAEYFEKEIQKRKEDLIKLMNTTEEVEEKISFEVGEFYNGVYSQNYSTVEELIEKIQGMKEKGNSFAKYIIDKCAVKSPLNPDKIIDIDKEKIEKELNKVKDILYGVYKSERNNFKNVESLNRARQRLKAIFADSQPTLLSIFAGGRHQIYYDEIADFKIRKLFSTTFEVKENAKETLLKNIEKEKVSEIRKYVDVDNVYNYVEKNLLFRTSDGTLAIFSIDDRSFASLKKEMAKDNLTLEDVVKRFTENGNLYTIDKQNLLDVENLKNDLKGNSELMRKMESFFNLDKENNDSKIKKILMGGEQKQTFENEKIKLRDALTKAIIVGHKNLDKEEKELLEKHHITWGKIKEFTKMNDKDIAYSLHKINFNNTKRFFADSSFKSNEEIKKISSHVKKMTKDLEKNFMSDKEFYEKYKISKKECYRIEPRYRS